MKTKYKGIFYIILSALCFAFMSAFVRVDIIVRPDFYKSRNENSN